MRSAIVQGFMGGAALLISGSCFLLALSGDSAIWATPVLAGTQIWNALAAFAWGICAVHCLRSVPQWLCATAASFLVIFALSAARDTIGFYALVADERIATRSYLPSSVGVFALAIGCLLALRRHKENSPSLRSWLVRLPFCAAGGLAGCLIVLTTFGATDYRRRADCAIVLGAAVYADGTASVALQDRVHQAVELYHHGHAPFLLMTGGLDPHHGQSEAVVMARLAEQAGVPLAKILLDESGVNTRASAIHCSRIMREQNWESALLVSHDYHLLRAKTAFARAGSKVYTVPATETRSLAKGPYYVLRECIAWMYYALPERG